MSAPVTPEFSRQIVLADLKDDQTVFEIEATEEECGALANRFGLLSLRRLNATLQLRPGTGDTPVRMHGEIRAQVTQTCVVTLEPVEVRIESTFDRTYRTDAPPDPCAVETIELEDEDSPETLVGGVIDAGEAVAEQLSLELDPFPKALGAIFDGFSSETDEDEQSRHRSGPFSTLAEIEEKPK